MSHAGTAPRRVLVVEDDPSLRRLVVTVLSLAGHVCDEAADPATAIELARRYHPAVILLDLRLGGFLVDHDDVRRLAGGGARVIAVTGHSVDSEAVADLGVDAFLSKPFRAAQLRAAVQFALPGDGDMDDVAAG